MVSDAGEIFNSSATDKDGAVLLQVVSFAGDINDTFRLVGKSYTRDFTKRGVRLFGGGGRHGQAYAALLRTVVQSRRFRLIGDFRSSLSD